MPLFYVVSPSIAVCARALVGLMRLFYAGMLSPSIAAYPSEPEVWWHFHAQSPATPTSLVNTSPVPHSVTSDHVAIPCSARLRAKSHVRPLSFQPWRLVSKRSGPNTLFWLSDSVVLHASGLSAPFLLS